MLSDVGFDFIYTSGKNEPADFFLNALMNSCNFDLGLGFFNSSGFRTLAMGFAFFIYKGGKMRFIINDTLNEDDKKAIQEGLIGNPDEIIEKNLIDTIIKLSNTLSAYDKHFFNCISWLISTEKLKIKAFTPIDERGGIVHQKFGLFSDINKNIIAFSGSANFSKSALTHNLETIECHSSWKCDESEKKRIKYYEEYFNEIWEGKFDKIREISIDKIKTTIRNNFNILGIDNLIEEERYLIKNSNFDSKVKKLYDKSTDNIKSEIFPMIISEIRQPSLPNKIKLHQFQIQAFENWKANEFKGLLEMATGTGKTITAINCVLNLYNTDNELLTIVLVPTIDLADQWENEIRSFNFYNIAIVNSKNPNWYNEIIAFINKATNVKTHLFIICTYASYVIDNFQLILSKFDSKAVLIADEVHNFGTSNLIKTYNHNISKRLGLSATPARYFDEEGTDIMLKYFNAVDGPTLKLDLKEAIEKDFLSQYYYYPKIVFLNDSELEEYIQISKKIVKYFNIKKVSFKDDPVISNLLLKRKRIIHKANDKIDCFREILSELIKQNGNLKYTLVYVPEGSPEFFDEEDKKLIDEYSFIIKEEFKQSQHQFTGNTKNRKDILINFAKGKISVLTAMKCLDEGVDVARTENAIFCASTSNPRQFVQRRGRILRKHPQKRFSRIYDMVVVPNIFNNEFSEYIEMEKLILENELKRVYDFSKLAMNKYQSLEIFQDLGNKLGIEIYK